MAMLQIGKDPPFRPDPAGLSPHPAPHPTLPAPTLPALQPPTATTVSQALRRASSLLVLLKRLDASQCATPSNILHTHSKVLRTLATFYTTPPKLYVPYLKLYVPPQNFYVPHPKIYVLPSKILHASIEENSISVRCHNFRLAREFTTLP